MKPATRQAEAAVEAGHQGAPVVEHPPGPGRFEGQQGAAGRGRTAGRPPPAAVDVPGGRGDELFDADPEAPHVFQRAGRRGPTMASSATSCQCSTSCRAVHVLSDQALRCGVATPKMASTIRPTGLAESRQ